MLGVVEIGPFKGLALALVDRARVAVPEALGVGARTRAVPVIGTRCGGL